VAGSEQLGGTFSRVQQQWNTTQASWKDDIRREFETYCWNPHTTTLPPLFKCMDDMARTFAKVNQVFRNLPPPRLPR
jgi:hypothetical protein